MIIYSNDKELIITTMEDINENVDLSSLYLEAESFNGRENRFFKILSVNGLKIWIYIVPRIPHIIEFCKQIYLPKLGLILE